MPDTLPDIDTKLALETLYVFISRNGKNTGTNVPVWVQKQWTELWLNLCSYYLNTVVIVLDKCIKNDFLLVTLSFLIDNDPHAILDAVGDVEAGISSCWSDS